MSTIPSLRERLLDEFGEDLPLQGGRDWKAHPSW
jgi:hypothetical protein